MLSVNGVYAKCVRNDMYTEDGMRICFSRTFLHFPAYAMHLTVLFATILDRLVAHTFSASSNLVESGFFGRAS